MGDLSALPTSIEFVRHNKSRKLVYIWIVERVIKITHLKDKNTAFTYWLSRTDIERLEAIEMLRQQYLNYKKNVQSRLQRVYRIINQKQS